VVERAVVAADGEMIRVEHLPPDLGGPVTEAAEPVTFHDQRTYAERRIVLAALEQNEWHITRAAEQLGLSDHASLLKIMRRLGVRR
jgi:transcriptional regulator of acetoin/glycerol metabolism